MEINNDNLLKKSDINRIDEMSQIAWPINTSLVFDMAEITKPKGNTIIEIQVGYPISSVDIEYTRSDFDKINEEITKHRSETDQLRAKANRIKDMAREKRDLAKKLHEGSKEDMEKALKLEAEAESLDVMANSLDHKSVIIKNLIDQTLTPIRNGIANGGRFRMGHTIEKHGEYNTKDDKIILYIAAPQQYDSNILLSTLVHELFHAFYHKHKSYSTIREIDEAMVEFSMLSYLKHLARKESSLQRLLEAAMDSVEEKKYGMGEIPAYGFGYYLYNHCGKPSEWIAAYYDKIGNIDSLDADVNEYVNSLNPSYTSDEKKTYDSLSRILFGKANVGYMSNTPNNVCVGDVVKKKISSNAEIAVVILPNDECEIVKIDTNTNRRRSEINIPSEVTINRKKHKITGIGSSVCMPPAVVSIPSSITTIAPGRYNGCNPIYTNKDEFQYYDRARTILRGYSGNSKDVIIPNNVISIGPSAFEDNRNLESIVIPPSVIHIWDNAFVGCNRLKNMEIPTSVVFIGHGARIVNAEFEFVDAGMTILKKYLGNDSCVSVPDTVAIVAPFAFEKQSNLETVIFPSTITKISINAFSECHRLMEVKIPSTATLVGEDVYNNLISGSNIKYHDGDFEFADAGKTILWKYLGSSTIVTIPATVTTIAPSAFENNRDLQSITIPASVTQIWAKAFAGCNRLRDVEIPSSVAFIGNNAFEDVTDVSYLGNGADGFPWGALQLFVDGDFAFENSSKAHLLRYLGSSAAPVIPNSITDIGHDAFKGLKILSIAIPSSVTSIDKEAFRGCNQLHVYSSSQVAVPWPTITGFEYADAGMTILKKYHGYFPPKVIPSSITQIEPNAFEGYTFKQIYNTSIDGFPWGAKFIVGDFEYADAGMTILKKYKGHSDTVSIPDTVTTIANSAFEDNKIIKEIILPISIIHIGDRAFAGCGQLSKVEIPDSVSFIGEDAFDQSAKVLEKQNKSMGWYLLIAGNGNKVANYYIGKRYYEKLDYQQAIIWFQKAADKGHTDALCCLGEMCYSGKGIEKDDEKAANFFIIAAEKGCSKAKKYLMEMVEQPVAVGWCHYKKAEVFTARGDYTEAIKCYYEAVKNGHSMALNRLKELAGNNSNKVPKTVKNEAKYLLGEIFYNAYGTKKDNIVAVEWYSKAAKGGDNAAVDKLKQLAEEGCTDAISALGALAKNVNLAYGKLKELAQQGNADAHYYIGVYFQNIHRIDDAKEWYFKAMLLGNPRAKEAYASLSSNEIVASSE